MASLTVNGFDDVLKLLDKLSNKSKVDAIAKKAVDAAKGKVVATTKAAIGHSEYGPKSTGSVAGSVTATETKVNSYGAYSVAKPTGRHPSGKRNAELAAYLEYGTATLGARPWRASAAHLAEQPCIKIIEEIVKAEMECD